MAKAERPRKKTAAKPASDLVDVDVPETARDVAGEPDAETGADAETAVSVEPLVPPPPSVPPRRRAAKTGDRSIPAARSADAQPQIVVSGGPGRQRATTGFAITVGMAAACGALGGSLATIGLLWLHPPATATADGDLTQRFARIDAEFAALKASREISLTTSQQPVGKGEAPGRVDPSPPNDAKETTGSIADTHTATVTLQRPTVEGWVLRNVYGGTAVVEGGPGLIQVMPGDSLPGVGRIEAITRQDGRWVVVTSNGLIVAR